MVGGRVVEVINCGDRMWVNCIDTVRGTDECAVYVERTELSEKIAPGDKLWWQGDRAFWTSADLEHVEVEFERLSNSGVGRPAGY